MEWEFLVPSICEHEPKMIDAPQQAVFGSYLLALLLLPLGYCCESTKPMVGVKEDYKNVIHPLLQNIENNITNMIRAPSCEENKKKYTCDPNNETRSIQKMVCSIPFKKSKMSKIKCDLWKLSGVITDSLECSCSINEDSYNSTRGIQFNCTHPHYRHLSDARLCRLRSIIRDIKSCYAKLTVKNS